jgi:MFS family permease|tara:strand:+ start:199 stop:1335 length:1137 start_codon:yes stop_codon:yes gene_type:complete
MNIYSKAKVACLVGISFPMIMWVFMLGHIPIIYKKLELSETSWGIFLLIFGLIQILTGQVCSRLITPRFGTKIMMFMGILLLSISFLIIIYITNYISFLIIACLFGISLGLIMPSTNSHLSLIEEQTKEILQPVFWAFMSLGAVIGAFLSIYLLSLNFLISTSFPIIFLIGLIIACIVFYFGLPRDKDYFGKAEKFSLPDKKVLIFGLILFLEFGTVGIIMEWSPLWLTQDLGSPLFLGALILISFHSGEIPSRLFGSQLINYFGEIKIGFHLVLLGCLSLLLSIITMNYYIIAFASFIFGFATGNTNPIVIRQAIKSTTENIPTTIANLMTLAFSGLMIGPGLVGVSAKYLGMTFNMYLLPIVWAICALIFIRNYVK